MQNFGRFAPRECGHLFRLVARMSAAISGAGLRFSPDVAALIRASVTGLDKSTLLRYPLAGDVLLYGIGARPSPDGVRGG